MNVFAFDNNVTKIDTDTKLKPARYVNGGIPQCLLALYFRSALQRVDYTMKFDEKPVTHRLDQTAVMLSDLGENDLVQIRLKVMASCLFVDLA
ncbi:hypothetical protein J2W42_005122 [Rhizobium tibeticum]|nr:hypothetical protein [Rhizobium tibeticum]